jgi:hypothetical protein
MFRIHRKSEEKRKYAPVGTCTRGVSYSNVGWGWTVEKQDNRIPICNQQKEFGNYFYGKRLAIRFDRRNGCRSAVAEFGKEGLCELSGITKWSSRCRQ